MFHKRISFWIDSERRGRPAHRRHRQTPRAPSAPFSQVPGEGLWRTAAGEGLHPLTTPPPHPTPVHTHTHCSVKRVGYLPDVLQLGIILSPQPEDPLSIPWKHPELLTHFNVRYVFITRIILTLTIYSYCATVMFQIYPISLYFLSFHFYNIIYYIFL